MKFWSFTFNLRKYYVPHSRKYVCYLANVFFWIAFEVFMNFSQSWRLSSCYFNLIWKCWTNSSKKKRFNISKVHTDHEYFGFVKTNMVYKWASNGITMLSMKWSFDVSITILNKTKSVLEKIQFCTTKDDLQSITINLWYIVWW